MRELSPELAIVVHRAEKNAAERDAALDMLRDVAAIVRRTGGFMRPEDQTTLREAIAMLAEYGRAP